VRFFELSDNVGGSRADRERSVHEARYGTGGDLGQKEGKRI
jgi:hypothetical protein